MKTVSFELEALGKGIPALTEALGQVQAESASVCLENQGHNETVRLHVKRAHGIRYEVKRLAVTEQMRRAYADLKVATEYGAYGIAILLVAELTGLTAVQRSWTGTGFDYWLGPSNDDALPFQNKARLEVSGILCGTPSRITARGKQKQKQTRLSADTKLTAHVAIIEFGRPQAEVHSS